MKILGLVLALVLSLNVFAADKIEWQDWSNEAFAQAAKENKLVLLDLKAVWCHWCHVMEEKTYSNPEIIKIIKKNFIAISVDQDARPDISTKYEDYGWPATIILNAKAEDLVKLQGYIEADEFKKTLLKTISNPVPQPDQVANDKDIVKEAFLPKTFIEQLLKEHETTYDSKYIGWGRGHKYLEADSVEWALKESMRDNKDQDKKAKDTLNANLALLDPVWGGVYQYSANDGKWNEPHFEKIMSYQADNIRLYALAASLYDDAKYLKAAQSLKKYLSDFLQDANGGFYTSQDADLIPGKHSAGFFKLNDAKRRAKGIPTIDKHQYARENGWAIEALAFGFQFTGDQSMLDQAMKATDWVLANRTLPDGGFRHDEKDKAGPYLADNTAMVTAFLQLYKVTQDAKWIEKAKQTTLFIEKNFKDTSGYASTSVLNKSKILKPMAKAYENLKIVRTMNLLYQYTADSLYKTMSEHAMKFIARPSIANQMYPAAALMADYEMKNAPLHLAIVGSPANEISKKLFTAALKYPVIYKRIEIYDPSNDKRLVKDISYPTKLTKPAAFICTNKTCSLPIYDSTLLAAAIKKISNK